MSLSTNVPNFAVSQDLPFLLQVKFEDYAKLLATMSGEISASRGDEFIEKTAAANRQASSRALLTRYVGFNGKLTELQTV